MTDRLMTVLRVYPRHHPLIDQVAERCLERLGEAFVRGPVTVELTPSEILAESGKVIFSREDSESERFIWYNPHSDGLRLVTFEPELDIEDLLKFMAVIDKVAQDGVVSDDDTITLLWDQHLRFISYRSLDAFVDAEVIEEFNGRTPKEAVQLIVEAAATPAGAEGRELSTMFGDVGIGNLDWFSSIRLKHSLETKPHAIGQEHLEYALSLQVDKIEALFGEWKSGGQLEFRFIEALLSIIRASPGSAAADSAQEAIEQMGIEMIEREMYGEAYRVLQLLKSRQELFEALESNPLEVIVTQISEPTAVEGLMWRMQKSEEHRDELFDLLSFLDTAVVERQCLKLLGEEELPHPESLIDLLFKVHELRPKELPYEPPSIDAKLLENGAFLKRLLPCFADRNLALWPSSRKIIGAALRSKDPKIQESAIHLDIPFWSDPKLTEEVLLPLVNHPEESLRSRAYEILSHYHPVLFERRIRQLIVDNKLQGKSLGELRFLFRRFAELGGERIDELYGCIEGNKGWVKGAKKTAALAAAQVLVERGDKRAVTLVEGQLKSLLVAPAFKQSLRNILRNHQGQDQEQSSAPVEESVQ